MSAARLFAAATLAALSLGAAAAHDGARHPARDAAKAAAPAPFPLTIRADFALTDQSGATRRAEDFAGQRLLLFFGYTRCDAICDVALPRLAATLDLLGADAAALTPVLITIDPANDTPSALALAAPRIHPRLIGLTGDEAALAAARRAFQVSVEKLFEAPDGAPVYAHGALIYLVGRDGLVETILPPILSPERIAEIVRGYL